MNGKYYLKIEIRYTILNGDGEEEYSNTVKHSDLFNKETACIEYGNNLIEQCFKSAEKLERRFGYPLVRISLKNGEIFISVRKLDIKDFGELKSYITNHLTGDKQP